MRGKHINITPSKDLCCRLNFNNDVSIENKIYDNDVFLHSFTFSKKTWTPFIWSTNVQKSECTHVPSRNLSCKRKLSAELFEQSEDLQRTLDSVSTAKGEVIVSSNATSSSGTTDDAAPFLALHNKTIVPLTRSKGKATEKSIQSNLTGTVDIIMLTMSMKCVKMSYAHNFFCHCLKNKLKIISII